MADLGLYESDDDVGFSFLDVELAFASEPTKSCINLFFFQFSCFFQALYTNRTVGFVKCIPNTTSPKSNNFYVHN